MTDVFPGRPFRPAILVVVTWILISADLQAQQNWTRFRGPNGTGLSESKTIPTKWSDSDYQWKRKLEGSGTGSPVVWAGRTFVTSCDASSADLYLQCFEIDGTPRWSKRYPSTPYPLHRMNSYAASTPAVDADHVYFMYANPDQTMLVAVDHDGKEIWKRDFGQWVCSHGFGTSPMLYEDLVIFCDSQKAEKLRPGQSPGESRVIAVNRKTGDDAWQSPLTAKVACYSVPCVFEHRGRQQLIGCNTGDGIFSLDPRSGRRSWNLDLFQMRCVSSPLVAGGMIFGTNGSGGGGNYLVALRPGKSEMEKAYQINQTVNYVPTTIAVSDLLFLFGDKGVVSCLNIDDGKLIWRQRVSKAFCGSPVATASHIYILDEDGQAIVIDAAKKFNVVSRISLGEPSRATPAIAGDRIYFRTHTQLICLGTTGSGSAEK